MLYGKCLPDLNQYPVAERNESIPGLGWRERDFGHPERQPAASNAAYLDKQAKCSLNDRYYLLIGHIPMTLPRVSISTRSAIILAE